MPICLDLCFHMPMCLDLCLVHALGHLPCACALHTTFVCLDLGYVCHAMCYCSPFTTFFYLSCVLAYWFGPDLDPMVFVIIHTPRPTSKGLDHSYFTCLCLLASMLYACVRLSSSKLGHVWCPYRICGCVVTFDAHEALFGCNHLGCISGCRVAPCIPFPFQLHVMLCLPCLIVTPVGFLCPLHTCLHVHALVLLASASSILQHNEAMEIRSKPAFFPHGHHLLFIFLLVCLLSYLLAHLYACFLASLLAMSTMLICFMPLSYVLCIFSFHCLSASFLSLTFVCTHMERGCMELGHGLTGASKKGEDVSMQI